MKAKKNRSETLKAEKVSWKDYLTMFKGISIPWKMLVIGFVAVIVSAIITANTATITGDVLDASGDVSTQKLVVYVVLTLASVVVSVAGSLMNGIASEKINLGMRKKLWKKILDTKQKQYDESNSELLVSRVTTDCDYSGVMFTTISSIVSVLISLVIYIVQMLLLSPFMTGWSLLLYPIVFVFGFVYSLLTFRLAQKSQGALSKSTAYLIERVKSLPLVKASDMQEYESEQGEEKFRLQYKLALRTSLLSFYSFTVNNILQVVTMTIPFLTGAALVANGTLTIGNVYTFYTLFKSAQSSAESVYTAIGSISAAKGGLAKVQKTFELPEEDIEAGSDLPKEQQDIKAEKIVFGYTADIPVLKNVSFVIPKNKVTALIGTNGSGKSTMFKLLERLYEPDQGELYWGEDSANQFKLKDWRKSICMVSQDSGLMMGTLRENICYGCDREITEQELMEVAKKSGVYDFVKELPDGFDTIVAPGATNFSGGQRQCIAIARAMLSSAPIIMMDEATSGMDAKRENAVIRAMQQNGEDRTAVIISHSFAAIRNADHVIILKDGAVEATGTPEEILATKDNYLAQLIARGSCLQNA